MSSVRLRFLTLQFVASALLAGVPFSEATAETALLTLDSMSFISFNDEAAIPIPLGNPIKFELGQTGSDGSTPFTVPKEGTPLFAVSYPQFGSTVQYSLTSAAGGSITPTESGQKIAFSGTVSAQDISKPDVPSNTYTMTFTTDAVSARSTDGETVVNREGFRPPTGTGYVQIVGATVAKSDNGKGSAVYLVLSGSFDVLPGMTRRSPAPVVETTPWWRELAGEEDEERLEPL